MAIGLVSLPILIYNMQYSAPSDTLLMIVTPLIVIGSIGFIILVYYGDGSSKMFHSLDILKQLSPPEPFIEDRLAVLNKSPVYGIAQWASNVLLFVAFHEVERTFNQNARVPKVIWTWEYKHKIGRVKVAIREDEKVTIAVEPGTYYTGQAIVYSLLVQENVMIKYQRRFNTQQLNEIVDHLANKIASYGSDLSSLDDEYN